MERREIHSIAIVYSTTHIVVCVFHIAGWKEVNVPKVYSKGSWHVAFVNGFILYKLQMLVAKSRCIFLSLLPSSMENTCLCIPLDFRKYHSFEGSHTIITRSLSAQCDVQFNRLMMIKCAKWRCIVCMHSCYILLHNLHR